MSKMDLKLSAILLFICVLYALAIENDDKEYDLEILRIMLRAQTDCPEHYGNYIRNCSLIYERDIKKCRNDEQAAILRAREASLAQRRSFVRRADSSCRALSECENDDDNISTVYGCVARRSVLAASTMNDMHFESRDMQSDYINQMKSIEHVRNTCTNSSTYALNVKSNAAIKHLDYCFDNGVWDLFEVLDFVPSVSDFNGSGKHKKQA